MRVRERWECFRAGKCAKGMAGNANEEYECEKRVLHTVASFGILVSEALLPSLAVNW